VGCSAVRMASAEIRETFLRFFEERGHRRVPSSPLVPADDPTLLFTNAGMVQFKDVFTGRTRLPFSRATSCQKCVRAGGKHNDLENVGRTPRHHTFFEMLGNFSFGDYFKAEAIAYAWELVTGRLALPRERLWVTVYREDEEAAELWRRVAGLPAERIVRLGEKDNFWAMGDTGPCGPCSEIVYDRGAEHRCAAARCGIGQCDCPRWLEIWNLVFMQFERDAAGSLAPLPRPSIDTGMGLERVASILQGVESNFDTDLFRPIVRAVEELSGRTYDPGEAGLPFRVIVDHARACFFLVADGVLPSNEGRGYVLRRILRRAARFGRRLGLDRPFLWRLRPAVVRAMGGAYPELEERAEALDGVVRGEEERFAETLDAGLQLLERAVAEVRAAGGRRLPGETAFRLYDTYGFPLDLTCDVAEEHGLGVDTAGFERLLAEQRSRARADRRARAKAYGEGLAVEDLPATDFVGYQTLAAEGRVLALVAGGQGRQVLREGEEAVVVLDRTPFYAEGGGQVGDRGLLRAAGGVVAVEDTRRIGRDVIAHFGRVQQGEIRVGEGVRAEVDPVRRADAARNHTATHLLHRALREVLGPGTHQAGSLVAPDRLRFDFTADRPLGPERLRQVEDLVNAQVLTPTPVEWFVTGLDEARRMGAMALFGEKYGERVRVVRIGDWSLELCGGTHVANTAEVGLFHVLGESGIGSGVRRVEAVTGRGVLALLRAGQQELARAAEVLRARPDEVAGRVQELAERLHERERELAALQRRQVQAEARRLAEAAVEVVARGGVFRVAAGTVPGVGVEELRLLADDLRARLGSAAVLLATTSGGRGVLLCALTPDLVQRGLHAGKVVAAAAAAAGGRGGGRPDLAHAGAQDVGRIPAALEAGVRTLRELAGA
jgi:alanyl-tRNA synthetase